MAHRAWTMPWTANHHKHARKDFPAKRTTRKWTTFKAAKQESRRLSRLQNKKTDDFQSCKTRKQTTFKASNNRSHGGERMT
jgi:hypothetical protein